MNSKLIQDLWILHKSGIVMFSRIYNRRINDQLFGALMSALEIFAQEFSSQGISNFELSNIKFILLKKREVMFVADSVNKNKNKSIIKELEKISNLFFKKYESKLKNWDNNIEIFSDFVTTIEGSLEEIYYPIKK